VVARRAGRLLWYTSSVGRWGCEARLHAATCLSPLSVSAMAMRRSLRRRCREHEREWNGLCVDRNLQDDWLVRLNQLGAFDVVSVCEGHCDRSREPSTTCPHIKLRLKDAILASSGCLWDEHKMEVVSALGSLFSSADTHANVELKFKARSGRGRLVYQEELVARVHGRNPRRTAEMDGATCEWFERNLGLVEDLDRLVNRIWRAPDRQSEGEPSPPTAAGP
jgi:hypothetical protein